MNNKFSEIGWGELFLYLLSGTILSQISKFILVGNNNILSNIIKNWGIGETNFHLLIYCLSVFVSAIIIVSILRRRGIDKKDIGFQGKITVRMVLICILCVIIGVFLYSLIELVVNYFGFGMYWGDTSRSYSVMPKSTIDIIVLVVSTMILTPIGEDTIFRGVLINFLCSRFNKMTSIIISAIFFALIHIPFYGPGLTIYMFFWTMISCMLFLKYRSLYPCMIFHILNNLLAYVVFPMVF